MIKIKLTEKKKSELEEKHWTWFNENLRYKINELITTKSIRINDKDEIVDEEIIKFLIDMNNEFVLKKILVGRMYNTINLDKLNFNNQKSIKDMLCENSSLDEVIFIIIKKHLNIFKSFLYKSLANYLENIKVDKLDKIRDKNIDLVKKNEECNSVKLIIKKKFHEYLFKYLDEQCIQTILKHIDNINIKWSTQSKIYGFEDLKRTIEYNEENIEIVKNILFQIFDYDCFTKVNNISNQWGAYKLLEELQVQTCPYCNLQFIYTYENKTGKLRGEIDHFYPKSRYPFLAISLYNFVPSCHNCNSSHKGDIDFLLHKNIYPYEEDFGECAKFQTEFLYDNDNYHIKYLFGNSDNFKLSVKINKDNIVNKIQNSENIEILDHEKEYMDYNEKL